MITDGDCDSGCSCGCPWGELVTKLNTAYSRATASVNTIKPTDSTERVYVPDGTGVLTMPVPTQEQLDNIGQVSQYNARITALETTVGSASSGLVQAVNTLDGDVDALNDDVTELDASVTTLETTVGNSTSGLVKDVTDMQTDVALLDSDVDNLVETVGDSSSGLVKTVNDHTLQIATVQAYAQGCQLKLEKGGARGYCGLDENAKVPVANLNIDGTATEGSSNPISSGAMYTAITGIATNINAKQDTLVGTTVTLGASDWVSSSQTVNVTGMTADKIVFVAPAVASHSAYITAGIKATAQASGTLTFGCDTVPTVDVTVNVVIA